MAYMDKEKATSAGLAKEHLAGLAAGRQLEKARAKAQAEIHASHERGMDVVRGRTATNRATHAAAMDAQRAKSAAIHADYLARHRAFDRTYAS